MSVCVCVCACVHVCMCVCRHTHTHTHKDVCFMTSCILPAPVKSSEYGPARGIKILEALSASGLRSLRYALEIEGVEEVVANDYSWAAFESIQRNTQYNKLGHLVCPRCEDARCAGKGMTDKVCLTPDLCNVLTHAYFA